MRNKKAKIWAFGISFVAHLIFMFSSSVYELPGVITDTLKRPQKIQVKVSKKKRLAKPKKEAPVTSSQPLHFVSPTSASAFDSFLKQEETSLTKDMGLPEKKIKELAKAEIPQELYEVKQKKAEYKIPKKMAERKTEKTVTAGFKINYEGITDKAEDYSTVDTMAEDFVDKMPGFTPAFVTDSFAMSAHAGGEIDAQGQLSVIERQRNIGNFDQELIWSLETYQDPEDQEKYFKVRIRVGGKAENLPTIPKELTILVDCSKSITDARLKEFKEGIEKGLRALNKDDVFNLIFFKEWNFVFEKEPVPPTEKNITRAIRFMKEYNVGEKTNTFTVLEESIKKKPKLNPSYLLLLSDGRPTKGITNARELINKISDINQGKKPIFTLTGGNGANRYLLDFISYKNRAWSEYSYRTHMIDEKVEELIGKINDPIIMNLRYFISGVQTQEVFPKELADFYRHAEFTLYGKYDTEEELAIQLLGDVAQETKEYLLKSLITDAEAGDALIAENWAYNKVYHLISSLKVEGKNKTILKEIKALSEKFNLKTPYLQDILQ